LEDFFVKLKLSNSGINPRRDIDSSVVSHEQLIQVFGKRHTNKFKMKVNEHLTVQECDSLNRLHQVVYARPLANGDYFWHFPTRLACIAKWRECELDLVCF
jgi:hypothetical protein